MFSFVFKDRKDLNMFKCLQDRFITAGGRLKTGVKSRSHEEIDDPELLQV